MQIIAFKGPLVQRGLPAEHRDADWGIVVRSFCRKRKLGNLFDNPSVMPTACHLPLHKGGLRRLVRLAACHLLLHKGGLKRLVGTAACYLLLCIGRHKSSKRAPCEGSIESSYADHSIQRPPCAKGAVSGASRC